MTAPRYGCPRCDQTAPTVGGMQAHMWTEHSMTSGMLIDSVPIQSEFLSAWKKHAREAERGLPAFLNDGDGARKVRIVDHKVQSEPSEPSYRYSVATGRWEPECATCGWINGHWAYCPERSES